MKLVQHHRQYDIRTMTELRALTMTVGDSQFEATHVVTAYLKDDDAWHDIRKSNGQEAVKELIRMVAKRLGYHVSIKPIKGRR